MDPKKSYPELSIVLVSMALAFFLDLLFDARLPFFGLNLPLFTILFLGGTTFIAHRFHWKMWKFLWFPATGMVFFSLPFAIHTSGWALTLSMVGLICSSFVLLMRLFGVRFHFPHPLHVLSYGLGPVIVGFVRNTKVMSRAFDSLPRLKSSIPWRQVAWGIGFAVPILLLFLVLFTNADPVFGDKINTFFDKILFSWIEAERFFRGIGHIVIFLLGTGFFSLLFGGAFLRERTDMPALPAREPRALIQSHVILGSVAALFALFLIFQGAYLFGGEAAFRGMDISYADYAKRGFGELAVVGALVLGLMTTLRYIHGERVRQSLSTLHALLLVETGFILLSAFIRLKLYIDAYGWTSARMFGLWFLLVIALLILLGLFHVLRQTAQTKYVREGALITAAALMVFAWLPTDSLALGWNIDRAREGGRKIHWRDIGYPYDIGDGMSVDGVLTSLQNRLKPSDMESFHSESELRIALCNGGDFDLAPDEMEKQQEGVIRGNLYRYRTFFLANQQSVPLEAFNFNRWRFVQTVKEVGAPFEGMATSPVQCDSTLPVDVPYRPDSEILNLNTQPDMVLPYTSEPLGMPGR